MYINSPGQCGVWLIVFSVLVWNRDQRGPYWFWGRVFTALVQDPSLVETPAPDPMPADAFCRHMCSCAPSASVHMVKIINSKEVFIA